MKYFLPLHKKKTLKPADIISWGWQVLYEFLLRYFSGDNRETLKINLCFQWYCASI